MGQMTHAIRWLAATAGAILALGGCTAARTADPGGSGPLSPNGPPSSIATTSSPRPSVDLQPHLPTETARRATAIVHASPLVARVVKHVSYKITQLVFGTSGTIPNLELIYANLDLDQPIEIPAGVPYFDFPSEDEPGYGQPIPLKQALRLSAESQPAVASIQVSVDLDNGRVLAIASWTGPAS
jgi:hypothetical protein